MSVEFLREKIEYVDEKNLMPIVSRCIDVKNRLEEVFAKNEHLLGLSANQVGIKFPMIALRVKEGIEYCLNPRIDKFIRKIDIYSNNPINFPGLVAMIISYERIKTSYWRVLGASVARTNRKFSNEQAHVFQGSFDQLHNICLFDKAIIKKWNPDYRKVYRINSETYGTNYYVEDDNKLLFGGLSVGDGMGGTVVGACLYNKKDKPKSNIILPNEAEGIIRRAERTAPGEIVR